MAAMAQPLQPAPFDVPLAPLDQHATRTGGPVGRIKKLINGIVKKVTRGNSQVPDAIRVEKRDGFSTLPLTVRDPSTGAISTKTISGATLLGTYGAQLIAIFLAAPFILSEAAACWESPTYNAPSQVLRSKPVYSGSLGPTTTPIASIPDSARIGTRTMYTWIGGSNPFLSSAMIIDDDGTIIRQPFFFDIHQRARVVADGTQFWIVFDTGGGFLSVFAYDVNGNLLGTNLTVTSSGTGYFDVTKSSHASNAIVVLQQDPGTNGYEFSTYTWNGSVITAATTVSALALCSTGRVSFLTNERNDHRYHVTTVDGSGPYTTYVIPTDDSTLLGISSIPVATTTPAPVEMTGHVQPTGNADYKIALSFLDATPTPQLNFTQIYNVTSVGVATLVATKKSLTLASRAFRMQTGGDYYAVGYYHSNPAGATQIAQSTYFLMDLGTNYQVTGRFEYGTAYEDWLTTADTSRYGYLSTPNIDPSGGVHIALAYRASSTIAITTVGDVFLPVKTLVDVVGIKDYQFGPDSGQPVEHSGALFLPGPEAVNYTGATFAEDGVGLIPEVTTIANGGGGSLAGTYEYVVVDEWTDNNGQRVRSPAGAAFSITGSAFQVTLTGLHNHVTRKMNLVHSVYRTVIKGGVQTVEHYKVSGSLQGGTYLGGVVQNDDTANTWTFTDNMIDSVAANNEVLYTDKGYLDHFPAPPFSVGLATFDRVILWGYDRALWVSGQKTEGDAFWFHPDLRIPLPTQEDVTAIKVLDDNIVVMCDGGSVFLIPNGPWPDATGAGSFPAPRILPFSNGCTGVAETISDGIIYSSTQGGIWLVTRDFKNVYIGSPVEDAVTAGGPVVDVATDDKQRTVFSLTDGSMVVYDQVTGVWGQWQALSHATLLTAHKGRIAYSDGVSLVWQQTIGQYYDNEAGFYAPISTTVRLRAAPGGIRRYKRLWQVQMVGEWLGDHDVTVQALTDDNELVTASATWTPAIPTPPSTAYVYELPANAATELCSAIDYIISDSFARGPTQGFALEALSILVGLGDRLKDVPATNRIGMT